MTDMSAQHSDFRSQRRKDDAAIYYTVFALLFVVAFVSFSISMIAGRRFEGGLFEASKRAAKIPAGYAVGY